VSEFNKYLSSTPRKVNLNLEVKTYDTFGLRKENRISDGKIIELVANVYVRI
jgi:hypothetical protein